MCIGIERIYFSKIENSMSIIPIMSNIRGIIAADFSYARRSWTNVSHCDWKFARDQSKFFSLFQIVYWLYYFHYSHFLSSLFFLTQYTYTARSMLLFLRIALHFYPYSALLSISPIAFCIAHPQASVHYRKYWISIMKYWMISDNRRAADIVRSQYVLAFLAIPTSDSCRRGKLLCLR